MAVTTAQLPQPRALAALLVLVLLITLGGAAEAQPPLGTCGAQLSQLAPCARYSVPPLPGQALPTPGPECCSALGSVSRDCACGAIDIINSLPAKCGLPRVSCRKIIINTPC
uniref:Bifunctional inhibitor/plant lipid transfer protein/seed storage helical domain-containing protein n=1 Tax=Triticum urartu TaxID=4572 RepID=A0A8R7UKI7_TRIUA